MTGGLNGFTAESCACSTNLGSAVTGTGLGKAKFEFVIASELPLFKVLQAFVFNTRILFDEHVRLDTDVTHRRTAVAEEDIDIIGRVGLGVRHERIQVHIARSCKVSTTKVHSKLVIDKDPNVVVTAEVELQTRLETEVSVGFKAEVLVTATIALYIGFLRFPT